MNSLEADYSGYSGKKSIQGFNDYLQALLTLLQWAWATFRLSVAEVLEAPANRAALLDLQKLVFICRASLRLLVSYIEDIYPSPTGGADNAAGGAGKPVPESQRLAECVLEVRSQLVGMMSDPLPGLPPRKYGQPANLRHQVKILQNTVL